MDFKESVIIPLKMFQRCSFDRDKAQPLLNDNLPSDVRVKLYTNERLKRKKKIEDNKYGIPDTKLPRRKIVENISTIKQPFVNSIIDLVQNNLDQISWNNDYKLVIGQDPVEGTNLVDIFRFLSKSSIVTNETDVPKGSKLVYDTLLKIGTPKSWIPMTFPRKSLRTKEQPEPQRGYGAKTAVWLKY